MAKYSDGFPILFGGVGRLITHSFWGFCTVDSAAGVLMSSLGSGGGALSPIEATELKAALDVAGHNVSQPSPQQAKGATLPREKSAGILGTPVSITSTPDTSSQTKSSSQSASTASLFR